MHKVQSSDVLAWPESQRPGQARQYRLSQSQAWLLLAPGSGFGFSKPRTLAQTMAFGWIFWAQPDIFSGGCELTKSSKYLRQ